MLTRGGVNLNSASAANGKVGLHIVTFIAPTSGKYIKTSQFVGRKFPLFLERRLLTHTPRRLALASGQPKAAALQTKKLFEQRLLKSASSKGPLQAAKASKAINLPSWRKIKFDCKHVTSGHARADGESLGQIRPYSRGMCPNRLKRQSGKHIDMEKNRLRYS